MFQSVGLMIFNLIPTLFAAGNVAPQKKGPGRRCGLLSLGFLHRQVTTEHRGDKSAMATRSMTGDCDDLN
jgi:hypothetical protein